jgi:Fe-S-cluster containining protein
MPEASTSTIQEAILNDYPRLSLDDTLDFHCGKGLDCFTRCCRDVSIVLTPYDVLRMKKALHLDSAEFLEKYTLLGCTKDKSLPVVLLKMNSTDQRCPLLTDEGCSVYAHRPWACRMYPLGLAEPMGPHPAEQGFYFVIREDLCHGHGGGPKCSIREWISSQSIDTFEMMGEPFKELMLNEFWEKGEPLEPRKLEMYLMACYDLDRFRRFVFETRFTEIFDVDEARLEAIRTDDEELLVFAMEWLRFSLFNEKTMKLKRSVIDTLEQADHTPGISSETPR